MKMPIMSKYMPSDPPGGELWAAEGGSIPRWDYLECF